MQLHTIPRRPFRRRSRRIGRGGKRGTTSGRGTKGQKARAGAKIRPAIRDFIKKLPKARGYRFRSFRPRPAIVDVGTLAAKFSDGALITPEALHAAGLVHRMKGRIPAIKVLGGGEVPRRLTLRGLPCSASARAKIEAAGGSVH